MREIEVPVHPNVQLVHVDTVVESCCAAEGLQMTLKGTLAKYPGCVHWHYKAGHLPGTLEITFWSSHRRLWFKISAGRQGIWIDETVERLVKALEKSLK